MRVALVLVRTRPMSALATFKRLAIMRPPIVDLTGVVVAVVVAVAEVRGKKVSLHGLNFT